MKVKLISISKPTEEMYNNGITNAQELIAFCARVSNPSNQLNTQTSSKLINYLIKNQHWSPLEMVSACLEIETTRDIAHQIIRHRSFSFQEFSQRYADPTSDLSFVTREMRKQDLKNRQNSIEVDIMNNDDDRQAAHQWENLQEDFIKSSLEAYKWAIEKGIAKEQARAILPEGLTATRLYMNGTLRSWVHFIELRSGNGTQKEHREVALECAKVLAPEFPMITDFISQQ